MLANRKFPNFSYERIYWRKGYSVIGIDEVGRGAFAGPVGVGGVVFPNTLNLKEKDYLLSLGINDSKKLSPKKRNELYEILKQLCVYKVVFIDVSTINEIGIGKATFLGMREVAMSLISSVNGSRNEFGMTKGEMYLLVDGFEIPDMKVGQKGIVRGDSLSISIAAASIIAKVERDRLMCELAKEYPLYGFEKHKGYGTLIHRNSISLLGTTKHHRLDFCKNTKTFQV